VENTQVLSKGTAMVLPTTFRHWATRTNSASRNDLCCNVLEMYM
jgi:hypothetical protein